MLHLKPVSEHGASNHLQKIYQHAREDLRVEVVPLVFQYLANFPDFLSYVWEKSSLNLHSSVLNSMSDHLMQLTIDSAQEIFRPSQVAVAFVQAISPHEKAYLKQTTQSVLEVNAKLLILTIGIRENIKGVFIGQKLLAEHTHSVPLSAQYTHNPLPHQASDKLVQEEVTVLHDTSSSLAPLFGNELAVSSLPSFFQYVDLEMKELTKTEKYLEKRVLLEQQAMQESYRLPHPLGASYKEIIRLTKGQPFFNELLSLLVETFPTAYPRMLFTTAVMSVLLSQKDPLSLA